MNEPRPSPLPDPSPAYLGAFHAIADARPASITMRAVVEAEDQGMLAALLDAKRRVLFARASEAGLTRRLGVAHAASLTHDDAWDGLGEPPADWTAEATHLCNVEARLLTDVADARERRQRLGDTAPLSLDWAAQS